MPFQNKFGWSYELNKLILTPAAGALLGIFILVFASLLYIGLRKKILFINFTKTSLILLLFLSVVFLPTPLLGGEFSPKLCNNIVQSYEAVAAEVQPIITPGSTVYYAGSYSPILMLYLPDVNIFPQQYEVAYSHYIGGDSDTLERYGYWNDETAQRWLTEADFVIVEEKFLETFFMEYADPDQFDGVYHSRPVSDCDPDSEIFIFAPSK